MTERITSMPAHVSVTCVQLPGQEIELARGEMNQTLGGCCLPPSPGVFIIIKVAEIIADAIENYDGPESISEWWDS